MTDCTQSRNDFQHSFIGYVLNIEKFNGSSQLIEIPVCDITIVSLKEWYIVEP